MNLAGPFPLELIAIILAVFLILYLKGEWPPIIETLANLVATLTVLSALIVIALWVMLRVRN